MTVEEIVDDLDAAAERGGSAVLGRQRGVPWCRGARPSYAHGYYARDNDFYKAWDAIARDRERFAGWIESTSWRPKDFAGSSKQPRRRRP